MYTTSIKTNIKAGSEEILTKLFNEAEKTNMKLPARSTCKEVLVYLIDDARNVKESDSIPAREKEGFYFVIVPFNETLFVGAFDNAPTPLDLLNAFQNTIEK